MTQHRADIQARPVFETNEPETAVCVVLTDGESVYDTRIIHPDKLPHLNASAQVLTEGELQWQIVTPSPHGELPNIRQLFEITTEAMTPLQTLYCHLDDSPVDKTLSEDERNAIQRQLDRVTAVLKYIQEAFHSHGQEPVPLYYYELGSGVTCNPVLQTAKFERFPHATAFQERYPNWHVSLTQPALFDLSDRVESE